MGRVHGHWGVRSGAVRVPLAAVLVTLSSVMGPGGAEAQLRAMHLEGQDVSPGFEGWIPYEDGSHDIVFGYMNRNWEEALHVPVGPENYFSFVTPGALDDLTVSGYDAAVADQGQPTYFQPRRNRFTFNVPVSAEMAEQISRGELEVVWTLTTHGSKDRAYGSLRRDYMIDNIVIMSETGALGAGSSNENIRANEPPVIEIEGEGGRGEVRNVRVGEPLTLVARVTDDGQPPRQGFRGATRPDPETGPLELLARALTYPGGNTVAKAVGLHFAWLVYRGDGSRVEFDPPQVKTWEDTRAFANSPWAAFWVPPDIPEDNRWVTQVTFHETGTYVLRGRADDGGLFTDVEITVQVNH